MFILIYALDARCVVCRDLFALEVIDGCASHAGYASAQLLIAFALLAAAAARVAVQQRIVGDVQLRAAIADAVPAWQLACCDALLCRPASDLRHGVYFKFVSHWHLIIQTSLQKQKIREPAHTGSQIQLLAIRFLTLALH